MHKNDETKDENNILGSFDFSAIQELDPSLSKLKLFFLIY